MAKYPHQGYFCVFLYMFHEKLLLPLKITYQTGLISHFLLRKSGFFVIHISSTALTGKVHHASVSPLNAPSYITLVVS